MSLLEALGYVGDTLSKPGRAVRGLLAGRPDELANLIPFSDTMGITDPSQAVHGRDLLNQWGMAREGDTDFGSTLGGFAVDVATDPLTFLGGAMIGGAGKLLGKTNASKMGAVAGTDAANGFFPLTDPIERLIPETEHLLRASKGATSEWAPLADDLRPVPGQPEFPPKMTPMGDEIAPTPPPPIEEPFSADNAGYMLAYGPGYREIGEKYGLKGPWESSIPLEMADEGAKMDAMRLHIAEWNRVLDDFDRMTPQARAQMGFPSAVDNFDLDLADEIAQLSPHAAAWQQLLGLRHAEAGPMRELAIRGALPAEFADDLGRQHERIQPMLDRWSDGSPLANQLTKILDEGTTRPSQVRDLVSPYGWDMGDGMKPGVMSHLPVDERAMRKLTADRHREGILEHLTAELDRFGGNYGMDIGHIGHETPSAQVLDQLRYLLSTQLWSARGYEGGVYNQLIRNPQQFAGEYAPIIEGMTGLIPQLEARVANMANPATAAQLGEMIAGIRGNLSATAPFSSAIEKATGVGHMEPLMGRLNLGSADAIGLARESLPEADASMLEYLLRHHWRPYAPPATA